MLIDGEDDGAPDLSRSEEIDLDLGRPSGSKEGSRLGGSEASWAIVAVVKKKIIFSKRPMPTTNKPTK